MEAVTAFVVGPLCFWAVAGMVRGKPWRHLLALIVSVCQLYGDVLYFATTGSEGVRLTQQCSSSSLTSETRGLGTDWPGRAVSCIFLCGHSV